MPENESLGQSIDKKINAETGEMVIRNFPDGETYIQILTDVSGKDVFILCTLNQPNEKILPLYFISKELKKSGANKITLVAPYLSYLRQDKAFNTGEVITAEHFATLISSFSDQMITIDPHLHRKKTLNEIYSITSTVLSAAPIISLYIRNNITNPVLIGPDKESTQWVSAIAQNANAPFVILEKIRTGDRSVRINIPTISEYKNHTPVLIDDIISTAVTMIETVKVLKTAEMKSPVCIGVHAVFSENSFSELKNNGAEKIITCNTIEHVSNEIDISELIIQQILKQ